MSDPMSTPVPTFLADGLLPDGYFYTPGDGLYVNTPKGPEPGLQPSGQRCCEEMVTVDEIAQDANDEFIAIVTSIDFKGGSRTASIPLSAIVKGGSSLSSKLAGKFGIILFDPPSRIQEYLLACVAQLRRGTRTKSASTATETRNPASLQPTTPPVLTPQQRDDATRRINAQVGWDEPTLSDLSRKQFAAAMQAVSPPRQEEHETAVIPLYDDDYGQADITRRKLELGAARGPRMAFLCFHHIEQAEQRIRQMDHLTGRDGAIYGDRAHRVKVLLSFPAMLRTRLVPAFSQGDLWDADGAFEGAYERWEQSFMESAPPFTSSDAFPYMVDAYRDHRPRLVSLFDEMLNLFPYPRTGL